VDFHEDKKKLFDGLKRKQDLLISKINNVIVNYTLFSFCFPLKKECQKDGIQLLKHTGRSKRSIDIVEVELEGKTTKGLNRSFRL